MSSMAGNNLRGKVLTLYRTILRTGRQWKATNPADTREERDFIIREAQVLFRQNKSIQDASEVTQRIQEAEARLEIAVHYNNPYPRPVNLPPLTMAKPGFHGKVDARRKRRATPIYIKSLDPNS